MPMCADWYPPVAGIDMGTNFLAKVMVTGKIPNLINPERNSDITSHISAIEVTTNQLCIHVCISNHDPGSKQTCPRKIPVASTVMKEACHFYRLLTMFTKLCFSSRYYVLD